MVGRVLLGGVEGTGVVRSTTGRTVGVAPLPGVVTGTVGRGSVTCRTPSGTGTQGVCRVGPPSTVLTSNAAYPMAGTATQTPTRLASRRRRPDGSTKTAFTSAGV